MIRQSSVRFNLLAITHTIFTLVDAWQIHTTTTCFGGEPRRTNPTRIVENFHPLAHQTMIHNWSFSSTNSKPLFNLRRTHQIGVIIIVQFIVHPQFISTLRFHASGLD